MTELPRTLHQDLRTRLTRAGARNASDALQLVLAGLGAFGADARRAEEELTAVLPMHRIARMRGHRAPDFAPGVASPVPGGSHPLPSHKAKSRIAQATQAADLEAFLLQLRAALPERASVLDLQSPVRSQGRLGSCTGWGATAVREMQRRWRRPVGPFGDVVLSPLFSYLLAKERDGHEGEGSWQRFVFDAMVDVGAVPEEAYPYRDRVPGPPPERLRRLARRFRLSGYLDLQLTGAARLHPDLIRAALSGHLLGVPQAVAVSLAVTPAWRFLCATEEGWTLYLDDPDILGGHAMAIVGYYWDASIKQFVFVLKNSWGTGWAAKNPVAPGCALVPERHLTDARLVWELLLPLPEAAPSVLAKPLQSLRCGGDR